MTRPLVLAALLAMDLVIVAGSAAAGPIEFACVRSGRQAANRAVCSCIDQVAEQTLNSNDQRRAAKFFNDPDEAHSVWISQKKTDDAFWDRYKVFGAKAEATCGG